MTGIEERPGIAERYAAAMESSNLKVESERTGHADLLIAAGWCKEGLGTRLHHLRTEFDGVAAGINGAEIGAINKRMLVFMRMRSLPETKRALEDLAIKQAAVNSLYREDDAIRSLTWQALSVWLDPNCGHCSGRGFNRGGKDAAEDVIDRDRIGVMVLCRPCHGSGKRHGSVGRDDHERGFVAHLMSLMERTTAYVDSQMLRALNQREQT